MTTTEKTYSYSMQASTVLRLWRAWENEWKPGDPEKAPVKHILVIGGTTGCWPSTIYNAVWLGYLRRTAPAHFRPTARMLVEVERARAAERKKVRA